jgi:hypothetical protein
MTYVFSETGVLASFSGTSGGVVFIVRGISRSFDASIARAAGAQFPAPTQIDGHPVVLTLQEAMLRDIAATVYSESYHHSAESEGIARVIRNRAEHRNQPFANAGVFWQRVGGDGMYGRKGTNYPQANAQPIERWTGVLRSDLEATIRALGSNTDITNGSFFWEGDSSLKRADNYFARALRRKPPWLVQRAHHGRTTFFAYNPAHSVYGHRRYP